MSECYASSSTELKTIGGIRNTLLHSLSAFTPRPVPTYWVHAGMRCSVRSKGVLLLTVLLVHTALGSPVVKRDVRLLLGDDGVASAVADPKVSLANADVFGGEVHENGQRDKRTLLKLKALGLGLAAKTIGTGVKAVGAGVKTVAVAGAKKVGGAALKVATTVGVKVAKAAITIGIAKLLLHLVFGKINQLIDFKTRLLGNVGNGKGLLSSSNLGALSSSSGSSSSSSGGSSSSSGGAGAGDAAASYDGAETTEGAAGDSEIGPYKR
ncbi:hypothetical protein GE061_006522 [Apolygus lucorum]|uniref:Uncharacterized protein n=1 Tax=Apolygus lucorum TaxID=248454 RepID=A0A8S9WVG9_APOLU|nr:hypothetical protein GE061_006522 [Apolygus lucorum]